VPLTSLLGICYKCFIIGDIGYPLALPGLYDAAISPVYSVLLPVLIMFAHECWVNAGKLLAIVIGDVMLTVIVYGELAGLSVLSESFTYSAR